MRQTIRLLLLLLPVFSFAACGSGDDDGPRDPCHGVICKPGQDCRSGVCVDREVPDPTACQSNQDCQHHPAGKLCDFETSSCVQCLRADHCPAGRQCAGGRCLGSVCTTDADCDGATPHCNDAGDACVGCLVDDHCGEGERCEEGSCVLPPLACEGDEDCAEADPDKPHCVTEGERSFCVACVTSEHCADGWECRAGTCFDTACGSDSDCAAVPGLPHCAPDGNCVECVETEHCETGSLCVDGRCEKPFVCDDDGDCAGRPEGAACDRSTGSCVSCVVDSHCPVGSTCGAQRCSPIACEVVGDCPLGTRCEGSGCVPAGACSDHGSCSFDPRAPFCNPDGMCVSCLQDGDCGGELRCVAGACAMVESCQTDQDCGGGLSCTQGTCRSCRTDDQCPTGICLSGRCSDRPVCQADGDCVGGACRDGSCVECVADLDCPSGHGCEAGRCVEQTSCGDDAGCGPGKVCTGGSCVASGCVDDSFEPDGGFERATGLSMGVAAERVLCPNDEDWFVFVGDPGDSILAELPVQPTGAQMSLVWFDRENRSRREIQAPESRLLVRSLPPAAAGRYYLRIRSKDGGTGNYRLRLQPGPVTGCTDILEPNDTRETPSRVKTDVFYGDLAWCGDDFYRVTPRAGQDLRIHVFGQGTPTLDAFDAVSNSRLIVDRVATTLLGGGTIATLAADRHQGKDVLLRLSNPAQAGKSYAFFAGAEAGAGCGLDELIPFGADRGRVEGTTLRHTTVPSRGSCNALGPEATWRVDVPAPSRLVVSARSQHAVRIGLGGADCNGVSNCRLVAASTTGILDIPLLAPGSYVISLADAAATAGPYELAAHLLPAVSPPAHESCPSAAVVDVSSGSGRVSGSTLGARGTTSSCGRDLPTVHYRFDAAGADRAQVRVDAAGPVLVSTLGGTCGSQTSCSAAAHRHSFRLPVSGPETVAITSSTGEAIDFSLSIETGTAPSNDRCEAAQALTLPADVSGNTRWAENRLSFPLAESCTGYWLDGSDVFYSVSLQAGQSVTATLTPGAEFDGAVYVMGDCAQPMCLGGMDRAPKGGVETLRFTAPAAGTYRLVVDGAAGGGSYRLQVQ